MLDSSTIPIPMDALLAVYVWNDKQHFWLYCLLAAAGSAIGGLVPYGLGRAGGELFLLKRVNRERYERMRNRFENQEFLAMMIPSMLPPPTPWKAFVFAAGVFEMRVDLLYAGRLLRPHGALAGALHAGAQTGTGSGDGGGASRPGPAGHRRRPGGGAVSPGGGFAKKRAGKLLED
jgi:membrane protein YqaA with SNARE-associated domain